MKRSVYFEYRQIHNARISTLKDVTRRALALEMTLEMTDDCCLEAVIQHGGVMVAVKKLRVMTNQRVLSSLVAVEKEKNVVFGRSSYLIPLVTATVVLGRGTLDEYCFEKLFQLDGVVVATTRVRNQRVVLYQQKGKSFVCDRRYFLTSPVKAMEVLALGMLDDHCIEVVFQPGVEVVAMKRPRILMIQQVVSFLSVG